MVESREHYHGSISSQSHLSTDIIKDRSAPLLYYKENVDV